MGKFMFVYLIRDLEASSFTEVELMLNFDIESRAFIYVAFSL